MRMVDDIETILGKKKPKAQVVKKASKTILVVDDDPILLEMYKDRLIHEGYMVITADNGKVGLEKTMSDKPDLILLDLMMPVMNGTQMLDRLRKIPEFKRLPVIVLTNAGAADNIRETVHFDDACEFLIKSNVSLEYIVEKIKFWLPAMLH